MFYFKRKIIIFVFLLCTISCASNPNNLSEVGKNFILIEKPSVNYSYNKLPKEFNIYLLSSSSTKNQNQILNGIIENYYYYKNKSGYDPLLRIIYPNNVKKDNECRNSQTSNSYSLVILLDFSIKDIEKECLRAISSSQGLMILPNTSSELII